MRARIVFGFALAALLVPSLQACSDKGQSEQKTPAASGGSAAGAADVAGSDAGGADPGPKPAGFADGACFACFAPACENESSDCQGDAECAAFWECLLACPEGADGNVDASCVAACPQASSTLGTQAVDALEACRTDAEQNCTACGFAPPDPGTMPKFHDPLLTDQCEPMTDPDACHSCVLNSCCESRVQCRENNPDCSQFVDCWSACNEPNDAVCVQRCDQQFPAGYADFIAYKACVDVRCSDACSRNTPACLLASCADEYAACAAVEPCARIEDCMALCPDGEEAQCGAACVEKFSQGKPELDALAVCVGEACKDFVP
ncbi:MAG TPA: hypothetical protein VNG33_15180 [Polyangiaceae bacterium]|nr:hypothetical protein [Polyangiaceae bacterium]